MEFKSTHEYNKEKQRWEFFFSLVKDGETRGAGYTISPGLPEEERMAEFDKMMEKIVRLVIKEIEDGS